MAYTFLSDEWIEAMRSLQKELGPPPPVEVPARINQVITGVPFGDGVIHGYMDTTGGVLDMEVGHLERPDVTVTMGYDTARSILMAEDTGATLMQSFMSGRIKIDGDITKLLAWQSQNPPEEDPAAADLVTRVRSLTA